MEKKTPDKWESKLKITKRYINMKCCQHYCSINGLVFLVWLIEPNVINLWFYGTYLDIGVEVRAFYVSLAPQFGQMITNQGESPSTGNCPFFCSNMILLFWLKQGRQDLVLH